MSQSPPILEDLLGSAGFRAIRGLERGLSPDQLYAVLSVLASARAQRDGSVPLPSYFRRSVSDRTRRQARENFLLSRFVEFFPDRLATPKWRERFETRGLHHLEEARERRGRAILVCFHFGAYKLIPFWLRTLGIPTIALIGGRSKERSRAKRAKDRLSPFPGMPTVLYRGDQLRQTVAQLSAGHVLFIAADREASKQITVPLDDRWSFQMATGAMRLAARGGAELLPCSMTDEGRWRFRLEIGPPIPRRLLTGEPDLQGAGECLLQAMLPQLRERPEACENYLLERFRCTAPTPAGAECV